MSDHPGSASAETSATPLQFEYEHKEQSNVQLLDLVDMMRAGGDAFVVYYASWCPDCAAVPGILQGLENAGVGCVVMCDIGPEGSTLWKSGEHYFKQPPLALRGIPSVVRMGAEGEVDAPRSRYPLYVPHLIPLGSSLPR